MKIGVDARCFAQGKKTGVEGYARKMMEAIFRNDQQNQYVLFFNAWRQTQVDWTWIEQYPHVSVKRFAIPNKILNIFLWLFRYPKIDRLCGGVDVFFMPNSNFIALSDDVPLILTVHDLSFDHYKRTFSVKRRLWHYFVNPRQLIMRAARIIAVSTYTKEDLCRTYSKSPDAVTVSLNGLTSGFCALDRNSIELIQVKEKYALPYHFILYFGTIEPRKNICGLIRAYTALRDKDPSVIHQLILAGSCGWKRKEIDQAVVASPYHADIRLITDIPEEDKEAFYALASVFVYPSFFEGFGFPPLEAITCGKPVITSHTSSLPEVVGNHAIMIDPYRIEEIADALHVVVTQKDMAKKMLAQNHAFLRKFHWDRNAQDFLRLLPS